MNIINDWEVGNHEVCNMTDSSLLEPLRGDSGKDNMLVLLKRGPPEILCSDCDMSMRSVFADG